jgi:TPR repeat protein
MKSAQQGFSIAESNVGFAYHLDQGVRKNDTESVKWLLKAAEQGEPQAQLDLAFAYNEGIGTVQNHLEAMKWLKKSAAQGFPPAVEVMKKLNQSSYNFLEDNISLNSLVLAKNN